MELFSIPSAPPPFFFPCPLLPIQLSNFLPIKNYHHPQQSNTITNDVFVTTPKPNRWTKSYPKLNTITWKTKQIKQLVVIAKIIHSLFLVVVEREREYGGGMAPIVTTNSEFVLGFLIAPNHQKVYNITSNNDRKREWGYDERDQLQKKKLKIIITITTTKS